MFLFKCLLAILVLLVSILVYGIPFTVNLIYEPLAAFNWQPLERFIEVKKYNISQIITTESNFAFDLGLN